MSVRDWILAASVGANLVLLGFLGGVGAQLLASPGPPPARVRIDAGPPLRSLVEALPMESRGEAFERFRREGVRSTSLLAELSEAREAFEAAARADPFDEEAAAQALERVRAIENQMNERSNEIVLGILTGMSAEERAGAFDRMDRRRLRRDGPRGDGRLLSPPDR